MSQTDAKNEAPWLLVVGILSISLWCEVRELSHLTENTFVSLRGEFDRFAAFQQTGNGPFLFTAIYSYNSSVGRFVSR